MGVISLADQWLRFLLPLQGTQVRAPGQELRSHMLHGAVTQNKNNLQVSLCLIPTGRIRLVVFPLSVRCEWKPTARPTMGSLFNLSYSAAPDLRPPPLETITLQQESLPSPFGKISVSTLSLNREKTKETRVVHSDRHTKYLHFSK